jgi:hypothetical protein
MAAVSLPGCQWPQASKGDRMDDIETLTERNVRFIDACRQGSWEMLQPLLASSFCYLDGSTGEVWEMDRYIKDLRENPAPGLAIDQVTIQVAGDTAVVSARSRSRPGQANRYIDTYQRQGGDWLCIHACVWPLTAG